MRQMALFLLISFLFSCQAEPSFNLGSDHKDHLCILLDASPTVPAAFAARELQYHLEQSMGFELPIIRGDLPEGMLPLCVGESPFTRQQGIDTKRLEDQEYVIRIEPSWIILAGKDQAEETGNVAPGLDTNFRQERDSLVLDYGKANGEPEPEQVVLPGIYTPQGTCYAVYDFLERFLGVRWYGPHPKNVVIPEHISLSLEPAGIKRSLAIKHRTGTGFGRTMNQDLFFDPSPEMYQLYDRRMRVGGEKWGCNHSMTSFLDRFLTKSKEESPLHEEYRPEFFAVGQEGQRQLCYTNEALIAQIAEDACDYFDGNPPKGKQVAIGDYFALVPHDNANWCKCADCQELLEKVKAIVRK